MVETKVRQLTEELAALRDGEVALRERFIGDHGTFLPSCILDCVPTLYEKPARFAPRVDLADQSLPDLGSAELLVGVAGAGAGGDSPPPPPPAVGGGSVIFEPEGDARDPADSSEATAATAAARIAHLEYRLAKGANGDDVLSFSAVEVGDTVLFLRAASGGTFVAFWSPSLPHGVLGASAVEAACAGDDEITHIVARVREIDRTKATGWVVDADHLSVGYVGERVVRPAR